MSETQPRESNGEHGTQERRAAAPPLSIPQAWPPIELEEQVWAGGAIAAVGPAATRMSSRGAKYQSAVPPLVSGLSPAVDRDTDLLAREAEAELHRFDAEFGDRLTAYGPILLRSEAASSSQIENLTASARQIFTAELGGKGARNAAEIAANTRAMISALDLSADLSAASICEMHRALMAGQIRHTPGQYRTEPVWIGTRADSPLGASYVAPDHARVPELMDDLSSFAQRDDIPGLIHVSVAHAQFETIHPFTDGNGRTGRALAQAMLRRHQITRNVAVPVSAGLLTDVNAYHEALTAYREGDPSKIVTQFSLASLRAIPNGKQLVTDLTEIQAQWAETIRPRKGSVNERLLDFVVRRPAFTAELAAEGAGVEPTNIYRSLKAFQAAGVLQMKAAHKGPTVWRSQSVLDAIDRFAARAGRRSGV